MATTDERTYPYPATTDDFRPAEDIQALAEAVDNDVQDAWDKLNPLYTEDQKKSVVFLEQQSAQSIPYNTATALTFGASSERHDTHGWHSTSSNTSRITPGFEGLYEVRGTVHMAAPGSTTDYDRIDATIYKNGVEQAPRGRGQGVGTNNTSCSMSTSTIVYMNGTTDYVELYAEQQNSAGSGAQNTSATGSFRSTLSCVYLRKFVP